MPSSASLGSGFGHSGSTSKIGASTIASCAVAAGCNIHTPAPKPTMPAANATPQRRFRCFARLIIAFLPILRHHRTHEASLAVPRSWPRPSRSIVPGAHPGSPLAREGGARDEPDEDGVPLLYDAASSPFAPHEFE